MLDDLKELLEHIDAPTRAEVIRRCAHYEREIKHLKEQYRQIQDAANLPASRTTDELVSEGRKAVISALNRANECTVFYCSTLKKFKVVTQGVRRSRLSRSIDLVGCYDQGMNKEALTEDLYAALEG